MFTSPLPSLSRKKENDVIKLTDWMEINALLDDDNSSSIEDLISELKIPIGDENKLNEFRVDVPNLLLQREKEIGNAYPFRFNGILLEVKTPEDFKSQWSYIVCLLISYIGIERLKNLKICKETNEIPHVFEVICTLAAESFLCGKNHKADSLHFGAPRKEWVKENRPFRSALKILKKKINDGQIRKNPRASARQDAGLDVVAWRDFPDKRRSKLLLLGQCAGGGDYSHKLNDLRKLDRYFRIDTACINAFFVPHVLNEDEWFDISIHQGIGIIFDRKRIALYAQTWRDRRLEKNFGAIKAALRKIQQDE